MRHRAKFCADRSMRCRDMVVFYFQDVGSPPSEICYTPVWTTREVYFVVFLSLCKMWFKSLQQFRQYASFNILSVKLKNAYSRLFWGVIWGLRSKIGKIGKFCSFISLGMQ